MVDGVDGARGSTSCQRHRTFHARRACALNLVWEFNSIRFVLFNLFLLLLLIFDLPPLRPSLGQDAVDLTLHNGVDNALGHLLCIGDDDASESDVDDFTAFGVGVVDKFDEILRRLPLLTGRFVGLIQEPVARNYDREN